MQCMYFKFLIDSLEFLHRVQYVEISVRVLLVITVLGTVVYDGYLDLQMVRAFNIIVSNS